MKSVPFTNLYTKTEKLCLLFVKPTNYMGCMWYKFLFRYSRRCEGPFPVRMSWGHVIFSRIENDKRAVPWFRVTADLIRNCWKRHGRTQITATEFIKKKNRRNETTEHNLRVARMYNFGHGCFIWDTIPVDVATWRPFRFWYIQNANYRKFRIHFIIKM